jgi:hypothetical protein
LETVSADKELVRSTMEVVTLTIEKEVSEGEKQIERRKWLEHFVLAATLLMFGVIGFQLMSLLHIQKKKQLVEDIPIIRNINMFKEIDSFDFLKTLSDQRVFDPVNDDSTLDIISLEDETPALDAPVAPTEVQP